MMLYSHVVNDAIVKIAFKQTLRKMMKGVKKGPLTFNKSDRAYSFAHKVTKNDVKRSIIKKDNESVDKLESVLRESKYLDVKPRKKLLEQIVMSKNRKAPNLKFSNPKVKFTSLSEGERESMEIGGKRYIKKFTPRERVQAGLMHELGHNQPWTKRTRKNHVKLTELVANRRAVKRIYKEEGPEMAKKYLDIMRPMTGTYGLPSPV